MRARQSDREAPSGKRSAARTLALAGWALAALSLGWAAFPIVSHAQMEGTPSVPDELRMALPDSLAPDSTLDSPFMAPAEARPAPPDSGEAAPPDTLLLNHGEDRTAGSPAETPNKTPAEYREPAVPDTVRPLLQTSSIGVYGGTPSAIGVQIAAPADGTLAFRSGLTGLPGVGILWTPGLEVRFGQEPGTYSHNSAYGFANLALSRMYTGADRDRIGMEAGLGYRWILSDVRGVRWIAGAEAGGKWNDKSYEPERPCIRLFWMMAGM